VEWPINWAGVCAFSLLSPSLSVTLSIDETSRPTFLRSGVTGLLEASVGRWLRFLIEAVPPRHGHIMPELARDMRQMRTFAPRMAMYKYTEQSSMARVTP
jgi:hypothetical protein